MFERFTDRARKVMALANQEAQRLNHEYIDTEHILLGILKEGQGVGATALKNLDIDLLKARTEVEKRIKQGPDMMSMGKLLQTPFAKKVIEYAIEEARNLGHNYVGTEHILLGLLHRYKDDGTKKYQYTTANKVLRSLGVTLKKARVEVMNLLELGVGERPKTGSQTIPKEILGDAAKFAKQGFKQRPVKCKFFQSVEKVMMEGAREDTYFEAAVGRYGRDDVEKKITDFLKDKEFVHSDQSSLVILGKFLIRTTEYTIFYRDKDSS